MEAANVQVLPEEEEKAPISFGKPSNQPEKVSFQVRGDPRSERATQNMMRRVSLAIPEEATARTYMELHKGLDDRINQKLTNIQEARLREASQGALEDMIASGDPDTMDAFKYVSIPKLDPKGALHREVGEKVAGTAATSFTTLRDLDMEGQIDVYEGMAETAERQSLLLASADKYTQKWSNDAGILDYGAGIVISAIPFADRAAWLNTPVPQTTLWQGGNLLEFTNYLHTLKPQDALRVFEETIDGLAEISDFAALDAVRAVVSLNESDVYWNNWITGLDAAAVVKPIKSILQIGKSVTKSKLKPSRMAEDVGDNHGAVATEIAEQLEMDFGGTGGPKPKIEVDANGQFILPLNTPESALGSLDELLENSAQATSSAHTARRFLQETLKEHPEISANMVKNVGISNIDGGDVSLIIQDTIKHAASQNLDPARNVLNFGRKAAGDDVVVFASDAERITKNWKDIDNVDRVIVSFGKSGGGLFETQEQAATYARRWLDTDSYQVVPKGPQGWFVQIARPLGTDSLKNARIEIQPQKSWVSRMLSDSRFLTNQQVKDRRTITDFSEYLEAQMEEVIKPMSALSKRKRKLVEETIGAKSVKRNPDGSKRWATGTEFKSDYLEMHGRVASDADVQAYEALQTTMDLQWAMNNLHYSTQLRARGVENFRLPRGEVFMGIERQSIEQSSKSPVRLGIIKANGELEKRIISINGKIPDDRYAEIKALLDSGEYRLVEATMEHAKVGDRVLTHTLVPNRAFKRSDIGWDQVLKYNPGPHKIAKDDWYIKNAKITDNFYEGDNTIFNLRSSKVGKEMVDLMNEARVLKNSDPERFSTFVRDKLPELDAATINRIDWSTPFSLQKAGARTIDDGAYKDALAGVDMPSELTDDLLGSVKGRFLGERDNATLSAIRTKGATREIVEADMVSPFDSTMEGLVEAFDNRVFGAYIDKTAMDFYRKFGRYMDENTQEAFKRDPLSAMENIGWTKAAQPWMQSQAERTAEILNTFVQRPNRFNQRVREYKARLSERLNDSLPSWVTGSKAFQIADERILHTVSDPISFWRGVAFHSKLGLFNPKQLFVQAQMINNIMFVEGFGNSMSGLRAYMFSHGASLTAKPGMLEHAGKLLAADPTTGWKSADHFLESHYAMMGWDMIGGSTAYREAVTGPRSRGAVGSAIKNVGDAGLYFFKKGEQTARVTAWHAAYLKWRKMNPTAVFDEGAMQYVRMRASDLTANMTRDMNAWYQRGFPSLGTQFWGFQMRTMEQMVLGTTTNTLSGVDRAKMFAGYASMYGATFGASTLIPYDWTELARKMAIEMGMDGEDTTIVDAMSKGLLSTGISMLTGEDFNVDQLGPGGIPQLTEAVDVMFNGGWNDKISMYELLGGASGETVEGITEGARAGWSLLADLYDSYSTNKDLQLTVEDILEPFEFITTVKNVSKAWSAARVGVYIDRFENNTGVPFSGKEALIEATLGVNAKSIQEYYTKKEYLKADRNAKSSALEYGRDMFRKARNATTFEERASYYRKGVASMKEFGGLSRFQIDDEVKRIMSEKTGTEQQDKSFDRLLLNSWYQKQRETKLKGN